MSAEISHSIAHAFETFEHTITEQQLRVQTLESRVQTLEEHCFKQDETEEADNGPAEDTVASVSCWEWIREQFRTNASPISRTARQM